MLAVDLAKQIEILKTHPDYNEVVRDIGADSRSNTAVVLLNNGQWFELQFSELEPGKMHVGYWKIDRPDSNVLKLLDWLNDKNTRN